MMHLKKLTIKQAGVKFSLYPNGVRAFNEQENINLNGAEICGILDTTGNSGVPKLAYDIDADIFQQIQIRDNTEYEFAIELPLSIDEYLTRCEQNNLFPFSNESLKHIVKFNGPDSCVQTLDGKYRVTGRLNFENHAGTAHLDLSIEQDIRIPIAVEVLTQKLDYLKEFQELLCQISEYSASLLIRFDNATETVFGVTSDIEISPMVELMAFRRLLRDGRLANYIREIIHNPSRRMLSLVVKEDSAFVTNPDWSTLAQSAVDFDFKRGGFLAESFAGYSPLNLADRKVKQSFDTKDNRFVKTSLQLLRSRLELLKRKMPKKYEASHTVMQKWGEELDTLLFNPFWSEIGNSDEFPNSMVMATRKGYREYVMHYLVFGLSLKLESEQSLLSVGGDIKPVFHLYEMWCYLMVHDVICKLTGSNGEPELSFANRDKEFMRDLISKNDKPIRFVYDLADKKVNLCLYYNKDFHGIDDKTTQWADSYSGVFIPDISISIEWDNKVHWLHFDAKYRLDLSRWKAELSGEQNVSTFRKDDIHKMHTYRDAVMGTRGSYVLFPGKEKISELYIRNPDKAYRDTNLMPSVGAFPLKPSESESQKSQLECISQHIKKCIDDLVENDFSYKEEYGLQ